LIIITVVAACVFIFIVITDFSKATKSHETETTSVEEKKELIKKAGSDAENNEQQDESSFNHTIEQEEMTDAKFMDYIHKMSHQKIHAEEKWGLIEITEERIDWLLESVTITKENLKHEEVYEQILTRWANGDFSHAVEDHNTIWELQGGTIGKAKRLLSEEEEAAYLEANQ